MGLEIKRNSKGLYKLTSTISDESYHPDKKWVTLDEAKVILINEAFFRFVDKAIELDMTFPNGYRVNDIREHDDSKPNFNKWQSDALDSDNYGEIMEDKFKELHERLKLDIKI